MDNQEAPLNSTPKWSRILLAGFVFVLLALGITYYASVKPRMQNNTSVTKNPEAESNTSTTMTQSNLSKWKQPVSSTRAYPLFGKNIPTPATDQTYGFPLSLYIIDTKTVKETTIATKGSGGASGYGTTEPHVSPNFLYTIYIDKNFDLMLLSHETLQSTKIAKSVDYITGWTPNSNRIVYHVFDPNFNPFEQQIGSGPPPSKIYKYDPLAQPGFYVFDISTGIVKELYPVKYIDAIIDSSRLLTRVDELQQQYVKTPIVFNIDTFEADHGYVKEPLEFGDGPFSFSKDGSAWTFLHSNNGTQDSSVVISKFPTLKGTTIESGQWADFQFPRISPDGTKVAYAKRNGQYREGVPRFNVVVYDATTQQKTQYSVEGYATQWIDNNTLIVTAGYGSESSDKHYILDLTTKASTKIY